MKSISFGLALLLIVASSLPVSAQAINGDWEIVSGQFSGQPVPKSALETMSLKIDGTQFNAKSGNATSSGTFSERARSNPPQLVFTINDGVDAGRVIKGIFKIDQTGLTIVFSQGDDFPTEFTSTMTNQNVILTYTAETAAATTASTSKSRTTGDGSKYGKLKLQSTQGSVSRSGG